MIRIETKYATTYSHLYNTIGGNVSAIAMQSQPVDLNELAEKAEWIWSTKNRSEAAFEHVTAAAADCDCSKRRESYPW